MESEQAAVMMIAGYAVTIALTTSPEPLPDEYGEILCLLQHAHKDCKTGI